MLSYSTKENKSENKILIYDEATRNQTETNINDQWLIIQYTSPYRNEYIYVWKLFVYGFVSNTYICIFNPPTFVQNL